MSRMAEAGSVARRSLRCLEISQIGSRMVIIEPGHPEYEKLLKRDEEASAFLDRHHFETEVLRGFWSTLLWF